MQTVLIDDAYRADTRALIEMERPLIALREAHMRRHGGWGDIPATFVVDDAADAEFRDREEEFLAFKRDVFRRRGFNPNF